MKIVLLAAAMLLSPGAFAEAYWSCQCFESVDASDTNGGVDVSATTASTLKDAQKEALKVCQASDKSVTVASCLRFVKADH